MARFRGFLGIALMGLMVGLGASSLAACGDDDDDNGGATGGKSGSGGSAGTGGASGKGGTGGSAGSAGAGGGAGSGGQPLTAYERLGGKDGVRKFVGDEVKKVLEDEILKTYFFRQVANPIPEGSPSGGQIIECFSRLVASVVRAEDYPGDPVNDPANTKNQNFACRADFKAMHAGLKIGAATFDAFVGVLAADLMPLVVPDGQPLTVGKISQTEFQALADALTGTKDAVVDKGPNIIQDRNVPFGEQP